MDSTERDQMKADNALHDDEILALEEEVQKWKREVVRLNRIIKEMEDDG